MDYTASQAPGTTHTVIDYTYDPLSRLTAADYSTGPFFHYAYDANGNRTQQTTPAGTVASVYDEANRLSRVGGTSYTWDDNGNLTSDGTSSYSYDHANRLVSVIQGTTTATYQYRCNGLSSDAWGVTGCESDRVSQTVNGVTTNYVLDQANGLTQVLSDGTYTYLYGNSRIGQYTTSDSAYFLTDALGSVRQLTDGAGIVIRTESYEPYGGMLSSAGNGASIYGFDGEQFDSATGLIYLRARYYSNAMGRFLTRDTWLGDDRAPMSYNAWLFGYSNPINLSDPSGKTPCLKNDSALCYKNLITLKDYARTVKHYVGSGVLPVEGFANFVDYAYSLFDEDVRGMMWGVTQVITGFDPNNPFYPIWLQGYEGTSNSPAFIGQDWLPYQNNPIYNDNNWGGTGGRWIHSRRGDWRKEYWDKTANQAYHFWFYASSTFFDVGGPLWSNLGNFIHDVPFKHMAYDYVSSPENEAPPMLDGQQVPSQPDYLLDWAGINYGSQLLKDYELKLLIDPCHNNHMPSSITPGEWIRQNLKE